MDIQANIVKSHRIVVDRSQANFPTNHGILHEVLSKHVTAGKAPVKILEYNENITTRRNLNKDDILRSLESILQKLPKEIPNDLIFILSLKDTTASVRILETPSDEKRTTKEILVTKDIPCSSSLVIAEPNLSDVFMGADDWIKIIVTGILLFALFFIIDPRTFFCTLIALWVLPLLIKKW